MYLELNKKLFRQKRGSVYCVMDFFCIFESKTRKLHITTFSTKQLHKVFVICPLTKSEICIRLKCPMKYLLPIYRKSYLYLRKNLALLLLLQKLCYWFIFIKGVIVQITINYNFLYPSKIEFDPKLLISFQIRAFQKPCYYYINLV